MNNYDIEVKNRFGETDAYKEYQQKTPIPNATDGLIAIMAKFSDCVQNGNTYESDNAQSLVKELQAYITANYYTCTDEILAGLGQMYVCDQRFKDNIDNNGIGTAEFINRAIKVYCNK